MPSYQIVEKDSSNTPRDSPVFDPEVVVAPGLVLGVVFRIMLVAGGLQAAVEVLRISLVQVVAMQNMLYLCHGKVP